MPANPSTPHTRAAMDHWYALARQEEEQRDFDSRTYGHSPRSYNARIQTYRNTGRALRLELETGEAHCSCHLMTKAERIAAGIEKP
jgi:hypothetical protein